MALDGNIVYAGGYLWYWAIDVHDPRAPVLLAEQPFGFEISSITSAGGVATFAGGGRMGVYDVTDPAHPVLLFAIAREGGGYSYAAIQEGLFYIAGDWLGFAIAPAPCPDDNAADGWSALDDDATRSPVARATPPGGFADESGPSAHMEIFDVRGRHVRTLERPIAWDERDETGRRVESGVYFARIRDRSGWAARIIAVIR